ncbi:DUF4870 domain-containing protein [Flavobacterium sp. '19STA2R22 D10 B1']|uniref:DUF4870 domain-containing protein n=1 Tax=Flavobacterium aerium TaxID=3037261 RepID=UPI00278C2877|nr:hypothetical protein [Flavobacterium sp. '19STA2R22 D10 B1']
MNKEVIEAGKNHAIISYFTIIGTIIALVQNNDLKNPFAAFHIRQALGVSLSFFALGYIVGYFDSWMVSSAFYVFFIVLWAFGFINALQGEYRPIPLVGELFQKVFKNIN